MAARKKTNKTQTNTKKRATKSKSASVKKGVENVAAIKSSSPNKVKRTFSKYGKNKYYYIIAVIMIVVGGLYLARGLFIAAVVNGKPIFRFQVIKQLESQGGSQVLESLVTEDLINQEVANKGIEISETEIQDEIDRITGIVEGQGTTLEDALALRGQTMDDLRNNIMMQKSAEKILEDSISVSDDEAKEYFEQNKSFYDETAEYEDLSSDIKEQLKQQKLQTEFQKLIDQLKGDANIIYFVTY